MTTQSFCQTATNDTIDLTQELVCITKPIMDSIVADLKSGDIAKEEVKVLNEQMELRTAFEDNLNKIIESKDKSIANCNNALQVASDLSDQYKLRLDKVDRQLKHKSKWVTILSTITITSIFINLINL